jgi:chloride channel 3/4/5
MAYNFPSSTMWRSFLCALAATVALSFMNPFRTGKLVLFQVSYDRDWHYFEIFFYIIIGIFGGLYGALVIKYNLQVQKFRRENLAKHGVSEAATLAAITAFIGYWNMFLRIDMTESLEILFRECEGGGDYDNLCQSWAQWRMVNSLLLATVLRIALVIISYGCKVPAGIFVPSMAVGATFGRMIGILVKALYNAFPHSSLFAACQPDVPCITPGTYAFLGAAAALAGVTRITVAVVVIMFELTGALTYILPTMLVVMITKGVGDWFGKGGISEQTIKFQGYPFLDKDEHVFNLAVGDVMTKDAVVLYANGMELQEVEKRLAAGVYKGFPIVADEDDMTMLGYAGKTEIRYAIGKARKVRSSLSPKTMCYFTIDGAYSERTPPTPYMSQFDDSDVERRPQGQGEREELMPDDVLGEDEDEEEDALKGGDDELLGKAGGGVNGEGDEDILELGGWVDRNPLQVQPTMPLEVVMDLFKKMGPRVILVSKFGQMHGLVTVKDLLKVIASQERAEMIAHEAAQQARSVSQALPTSANGHLRIGVPRGGMRAASLHEFGVGDFGGELEILLKDGWQWTKAKAAIHVKPTLDRLRSSGSRSRSRPIYANPTSGSSSTRQEADGSDDTTYFVLDDDEETGEDIGMQSRDTAAPSSATPSN